MASIFQLFPGIQVFDEQPVEVANPYTGQAVTLTPEEVAVYDYLKGCEMMGDYSTLRRALDWFMRKNPQAYMTLLD